MIGAKVGHFTIKQKLGEGGMGAVYVAEHDLMRKKAAIKVLLPQWTQSPSIVERFTNEAIAMGALEHPNIVSVSDCGQLADGSWYIVMEYLAGGTLGGFCASQGGPLSVHDMLHVIAQVAAGLEAAHRIGIVHRDLKPENIFLIQKKSNLRFVKILDWGISKLGEQEGRSITRTGVMAGTPSYMAPEQMKDLRTVDRRSDVFALGAIVYQMLTGGWLPFARKDRPSEFGQLSLVSMHEVLTTQPPTDPRLHVPGLDARLVNAILAALHPDPARRPPTPRAFVLMLAAAIPGDGFSPSGTDIVKEVASELLEIGNLEETVRGPKPASMPRSPSRYRLGDQLGAGGMAEVFRATQLGAEGFSRVVAVKRVLPGFSTVPQFASMFVQEAKLASLLDHPNIVSVLDFDRDEESRLFLAMEYIAGRDLAALASTGRIPFSVINFIITEVLRGLGYAHDLPTNEGPRGIVHRDISPQNVLLSWEGAVKVSDFGIAKAREASQATASTMIKGKPQYMSPEQANGEALDGRSDLFAVGIVLWELLTGRRLFDGSTNETLVRIVHGNVPPPSSVAPDIPHDLDAITMKLLTRDRFSRYFSAGLAIDDLAACAHAPRNGRGELARLLAERFPESMAQRAGRASSAGSGVDSAASGTVRERPSAEAVTRRDGAPQPTPAAWNSETTLRGAIGQATVSARTKRRAPLIASVAVALVGLISAAIYVATRSAKSQRAVAPQPTLAPPAPASASVPPRAVLKIVSDPPGVLIRVAGVDHGVAPVEVSVERGQPLLVEGSLAGYESARRDLTPTQDDTLLLRLQATPIPVDARSETPADAARKKPGRKNESPGRDGAAFNPDDVAE
jgi:serine/threonine protein kinase